MKRLSYIEDARCLKVKAFAVRAVAMDLTVSFFKYIFYANSYFPLIV